MINISEQVQTFISDAVIVDILAANAPLHPVYPVHGLNNFDEFIQHYIDAGITWTSLTVSADMVQSIETTLKVIAAGRDYILRRPDKFIFVDTVDDILQAKREGKLGLNFNFQGTNPLLGDLNLVETYRRLGVGHMLMAYNQKNGVGDGCHEQTDAGLSRYGERLIQEMNRVGMIVDATHTGYRTTLDMFEISSAPVIFSHSNPRALVDHDRCIRDDQIKACANTGGVVGISGVGLFLSDQRNDISAEVVAQHVDYVAQLVGPRHVGFGLDFVGYPTPLQIEMGKAIFKASADTYPDKGGYNDGPMVFAPPGVIIETANCLLNRGYSDTDVQGILGDNFLRVCREVWL